MKPAGSLFAKAHFMDYISSVETMRRAEPFQIYVLSAYEQRWLGCFEGG
jgi:hypothetical protein